MTLAQEQIWADFVAQPANASLFTADATLTFVPTAAGASGLAELQRFFKQNAESLQLILAQESSWLKQRSFGQDFVVEEKIVRFAFEEEAAWFLPTVKPNGQRIQIPVISFATFANDKISSMRVHWDQASVLRQIGMLSSELSKWTQNLQHPVYATKVPVLSGHEICTRFAQEMSAPVQESFSKLQVDVPAHHGRRSAKDISESVQADAPVFHGRRSAKDIMSGTGASEPLATGRGSHQYPVSHVFDSADYKEPAATPRTSVSSTPRGSVAGGLVGSDAASAGLSANTNKNFNNQSHFSLNNQDSGSAAGANFHPGKRQINYHNKSSFDSDWQSSGNYDLRKDSSASVQPVNVWESSSNGLGSIQNRPSSRVLKNPGGGSSIQIG